MVDSANPDDGGACSGSEKALRSCDGLRYNGETTCDHSQDVGVKCYPHNWVRPMCTFEDMRSCLEGDVTLLVDGKELERDP